LSTACSARRPAGLRTEAITPAVAASFSSAIRKEKQEGEKGGKKEEEEERDLFPYLLLSSRPSRLPVRPSPVDLVFRDRCRQLRIFPGGVAMWKRFPRDFELREREIGGARRCSATSRKEMASWAAKMGRQGADLVERWWNRFQRRAPLGARD
jgi:hypothetical protein